MTLQGSFKCFADFVCKCLDSKIFLTRVMKNTNERTFQYFSLKTFMNSCFIFYKILVTFDPRDFADTQNSKECKSVAFFKAIKDSCKIGSITFSVM